MISERNSPWSFVSIWLLTERRFQLWLVLDYSKLLMKTIGGSIGSELAVSISVKVPL